MVDPTTVFKSLAIQSHLSNVGSWDSPLNANFVTIDSLFGGVTTIQSSVGNQTLGSSQTNNLKWNLVGTLPSNITLTVPSTAGGSGSYIFDNNGSGSFT